jgi:hypothetical protein
MRTHQESEAVEARLIALQLIDLIDRSFPYQHPKSHKKWAEALLARGHFDLNMDKDERLVRETIQVIALDGGIAGVLRRLKKVRDVLVNSLESLPDGLGMDHILIAFFPLLKAALEAIEVALPDDRDIIDNVGTWDHQFMCAVDQLRLLFLEANDLSTAEYDED